MRLEAAGIDVPLSLLCDICGKRFSYQLHLKKHKIREHYLKPFQCSTCQKGFTSKESLQCHSCPGFLCLLCPETFKTSEELKDHCKVHEQGLIHCPICRDGFSERGLMESHLREHSQELPYNCKLCSMKFSENRQLTEHSSTVHGCQNYFICSECFRRFDDESDLKIHSCGSSSTCSSTSSKTSNSKSSSTSKNSSARTQNGSTDLPRKEGLGMEGPQRLLQNGRPCQFAYCSLANLIGHSIGVCYYYVLNFCLYIVFFQTPAPGSLIPPISRLSQLAFGTSVRFATNAFKTRNGSLTTRTRTLKKK